MENTSFLIVRHLTIFIIIFGIVFTEMDNVNFFAVILILIFIINNQLRYFLFKGKTTPVFFSILFEWTLGYISYRNYGSLLLPYFIIGIIDSFFLLDGYSRYVASFLGVATLVYAGRNLPINQLLSYVTTILSLGLITSSIKEEQGKKVKAEDLYHKLRKSEDNLIKSNRELELYADSIKYLSILRERNRISRDIHDSIGHSLSTIIIQLGAIEKIAIQDGEGAASMASNLREFAKNGLEEIREALKELKPKEFKEYETLLAIEGLIKDFSKLTDINVKLGFSKNKWPLDEDLSIVIYRIIQEFLSNTAKHGKADKVNIFMNFNDNDLILTLKDNGIGTNNIIPGMGLTSLTERIKEIGGKSSYESKQGQGFFLRVVFNGGCYESN